MNEFNQLEEGFKRWRSSKRPTFVRKILWGFGHILGIYTIEEYVFLGKKIATEKGILRIWHQIKRRKIGNIRGLSIESFERIGEGLVLPHGVNIMVNSRSIIGANCTIYQGVTVGCISEGKRKGEPIIEENVIIGPNAVVVGGITIGHDSVIAGNAFVNFDVPANSVVVGNPGVIHKKKA